MDLIVFIDCKQRSTEHGLYYSLPAPRLPISPFPLCPLCPLWFVKKWVFFEREGSNEHLYLEPGLGSVFKTEYPPCIRVKKGDFDWILPPFLGGWGELLGNKRVNIEFENTP